MTNFLRLRHSSFVLLSRLQSGFVIRHFRFAYGTLARREALGRNDGGDHLHSLPASLLARLVVRAQVTLEFSLQSRRTGWVHGRINATRRDENARQIYPQIIKISAD
jgi:hypothetical protein